MACSARWWALGVVVSALLHRQHAKQRYNPTKHVAGVVGLQWHQWHCRDLAIVTSHSPRHRCLHSRRTAAVVAAVLSSPCYRRRFAVPLYRRRTAVSSPLYRRRCIVAAYRRLVAAVVSPPCRRRCIVAVVSSPCIAAVSPPCRRRIVAAVSSPPPLSPVVAFFARQNFVQQSSSIVFG